MAIVDALFIGLFMGGVLGAAVDIIKSDSSPDNRLDNDE